MTSGFDPALAQSLGFDRTDLECNQRGTLSPNQIARLRAEHTGMVGQSHVAAIVMGVFYVGVTIAGVVGAAREGGTVLALQVAGVLIGIGALAGLANVIHYYRTRRGPGLRVYRVEGMARCREESDSFRVDIGSVTFYVAATVYGALCDGQRYRVYYVDQPFVHMLRPVSAEVAL